MINDSTPVYTNGMIQGAKKFQKRTGLSETGKIGTTTLFELNKPLSYRIKQIMINMERLRWFPVSMEKEYIVVNIPEYKLHLFEIEKVPQKFRC